MGLMEIHQSVRGRYHDGERENSVTKDYSKTQIAWLQWEYEMLIFFVKGIPFQDSDQGENNLLIEKDPESCPKEDDRAFLLQDKQKTRCLSRISDIQRRISNEKERILHLAPEDRDEEYIQAWNAKVEEIESYVRDLNQKMKW